MKIIKVRVRALIEAEAQVSARTSIRKLLDSPLNSPIPNNRTAEGIEKLREIDGDICTFLQICSPNIYEKTILLIDHIIIMDKLNECGESAWENDDRHLCMHDLEAVLSEFGPCSSSLNLKESVYYFAACLFFKVHDYDKSLFWFNESKCVYEKNTAGNDLFEVERIRRDIFIAFCYEYTGHPEKAIAFLLDINSIDIFETAIYAHKGDIVNDVVNPECKRNKYFFIKRLLLFPEFHHDSIFVSLLSGEKINKFETEIAELIHVFAHCLSEYKIKTDDFEDTHYGKVKFVNLIRLISTKLIDTLDDKYITCKATVRAEGGDRDAALEMLPDPAGMKNPKEAAEINFYRFYFTELFSDMFESIGDDVISAAGQAFYSYCIDESSDFDDDSRGDALLHYHIFEVKYRLRTLFEEILREKNNRNSRFFEIDFENIGDQWQKSYYAVMKNEGLSPFANAEIKKELRLLRLCLNILLEVQANNLPLFFTNDEEDAEFSFEVGENQLFELCKMFSSLFLSSMRPILPPNSTSSSTYRFYYINNLRFDILADNYSEFEELIQKSFDIEDIEKVPFANIELDQQFSATKIVFGEDSFVEKRCELYRQQLIRNPELNIRVFYVGKKTNRYIANPIVACENLKTCVLIAFIYATIEYVIDYICRPRPIYILAPLRDTGSYYFQAANLERFVPLCRELSDIHKMNSEGIGIIPRFNIPKAKERFECHFINDDVKRACCCALIYKNNKLFVLRGTDFVEKENINHSLVQHYYTEYAMRREKCRKCSVVHDDNQRKCSFNNSLYCDYVFRRSDALAHDNATNNPVAKQLLIELIVIACKEECSDYDNLYVLENTIISGVFSPLSKKIYLFNKDLRGSCPKTWLSTEESNVCSGEEKMPPPPDAQAKYQESVQRTYKQLLKQRDDLLDKWEKYRINHKKNTITQGMLKSLNDLKESIEQLKQNWLSKSASSEQEYEKLSEEFFDCDDLQHIQKILSQASF